RHVKKAALERFFGEDNVGDIGSGDPPDGEAVGDGPMGEPAVVFHTGEALLLSRRGEAAVDDEGGIGVVAQHATYAEDDGKAGLHVWLCLQKGHVMVVQKSSRVRPG